jgi:hypothetical protein
MEKWKVENSGATCFLQPVVKKIFVFPSMFHISNYSTVPPHKGGVPGNQDATVNVDDGEKQK